jgi:hypothetical protein
MRDATLFNLLFEYHRDIVKVENFFDDDYCCLASISDYFHLPNYEETNFTYISIHSNKPCFVPEIHVPMIVNELITNKTIFYYCTSGKCYILWSNLRQSWFLFCDFQSKDRFSDENSVTIVEENKLQDLLTIYFPLRRSLHRNILLYLDRHILEAILRHYIPVQSLTKTVLEYLWTTQYKP